MTASKPRMFFGRGLLDIYNAAMHSPCEEDADDFGGHTLVAHLELRVYCLCTNKARLFVYNSIGQGCFLTWWSPEERLTISKSYDESIQDQTSACIVSVSGMITTFDFVGALIALLVSECPEGANIKAAVCKAHCSILLRVLSQF